jgi:hypothetical protein
MSMQTKFQFCLKMTCGEGLRPRRKKNVLYLNRMNKNVLNPKDYDSDKMFL